MALSKGDWVGQVLSNGRYEVVDRLGEGGMGSVYRVRDTNIDADVVIKVPRRALLDDPEFATRFAREIRSLVRLAHPNIVRVSDVGEHDDLPFAVMQYLSGGSLEDLQARDASGRSTPVDPRAIAGWLGPVAAALDFVHAQGYIHRDVKPGNILFDAHGHVFLSDFGVAKAIASAEPAGQGRRNSNTGTGMVLGTPEYMAPELIMGRVVDGKIDQYALAVTVYELLCGRRPFEASTGTAVLIMQANSPPPPLDGPGVSVSRAVEQVVMKGLSKDPGDRHPSCAEFARAFGLAASSGADPEVAARGRTSCPVCGRGLALPVAAPGSAGGLKGKTFACPGCQSRLRFGDDGRTLLPAETIAPRATPSTGTRRFSGPEIPAAIGPGRVSPATRIEPAAGSGADPGGPPGAIDEEASPSGRTLPLAWIGAGVAALLVIAGIVAVVPRGGDRSGTIRIELEAPEGPLSITLDGRPIERSALGGEMVLAPGNHVLAATGRGVADYWQVFEVRRGGNPAFRARVLHAVADRNPARPAPAGIGDIGPILAGESPPAKKEGPSPAGPPGSMPSPSGGPRPAGTTGAPGRPPAEQFAAKVAADIPGPAPGRFEKDEGPADHAGAEVDPVATGVTLDLLMTHPEKYADKVITPSGRHLIENTFHAAPGGVSIPVYTPKVRYPNSKAAADLLLDPGLARAIREEIARDRLATGAQLRYDAIPTVRVMRGSPGGKGFLVQVVKIEYLCMWNFELISKNRYEKAFGCLAVTPDGGRIGTGDGKDWAQRIGGRTLSKFKVAWNTEKIRQASQQLGAIQKYIDNGTAAAGAQQQAAQAAMIRRLMGN